MNTYWKTDKYDGQPCSNLWLTKLNEYNYNNLINSKTVRNLIVENPITNHIDEIYNLIRNTKYIIQLIKANRLFTIYLYPFLFHDNDKKQIYNSMKNNRTITNIYYRNSNNTIDRLINKIVLSNRILKYKLQIVNTLMHCKDKLLCKLVINKVIQYMKLFRYDKIDDSKFDVIYKRYDQCIWK
jgi:hypothetical protein